MDFLAHFLYQRPTKQTTYQMGYGCSVTFDLLISMSYTQENKKIRVFVYQAPEKKIRSPHRLQYEKKVPLDNTFSCSYEDIIDPKFKGELMSK